MTKFELFKHLHFARAFDMANGVCLLFSVLVTSYLLTVGINLKLDSLCKFEFTALIFHFLFNTFWVQIIEK